MSNKIKELIDRLRCPKIQSCPVDTNRLSCSQCRKSLHNDAAEALENLDRRYQQNAGKRDIVIGPDQMGSRDANCDGV